MKKTKRALLLSCITMLMCLSMLVGSTFAWFTDTATTGVNSITSGTLDVDLEMLVDGKWVPAEGQSLGFVDDEGNILTDILWEPGCSYLLQPFRIINNGSLALKFDIVISGMSGDVKLAEVIEYGLMLGPVDNLGFVAMGDLNSFNGLFDGIKDSVLKPGESMDTSTDGVTLHMKETAGNEYQDLTLSGISITVLATQATVEEDSYDDQYDKDAEYDLVVDNTNKVVHVASAEALLDMAAAMNSGVSYNGYTIEIENDIDLAGKTWTSIAAWDPEKGDLVIDGNGHTISNMTVSGGSKTGFIGTIAGKATIKDLTFANATVTTSGSFAGVVIGYQYGNVVIDNVHVVNSTVSSTAQKGIRIGGLVGASFLHDGAKLTVTNSSVTGSLIKAYHNVGGLVGTLYNYDTMDTWTLTGNTVADTVIVYGSGNAKHANALATNGGTFANPEIPNNSVENVTIVAADKLTTISTAEELIAFEKAVNGGDNYAGKTVVLMADIDLNNVAWTPIGQTGATEFKGVFNGNGHTISNLNINNIDESANCATGLFGWIESHGDEGVTVKNLTIDGATVKGHHYVGVIVGYVYGTIENCHVNNATVECTSANADANGDKAGLIAGYVGEDASITGCTGADSAISAGRDAGQIVGAAKPACVTGCSATNVTVTANGTSTGANIREAVIGRVL